MRKVSNSKAFDLLFNAYLFGFTMLAAQFKVFSIFSLFLRTRINVRHSTLEDVKRYGNGQWVFAGLRTFCDCFLFCFGRFTCIIMTSAGVLINLTGVMLWFSAPTCATVRVGSLSARNLPCATELCYID